jgi:hypothetical protein
LEKTRGPLIGEEPTAGHILLKKITPVSYTLAFESERKLAVAVLYLYIKKLPFVLSKRLLLSSSTELRNGS